MKKKFKGFSAGFASALLLVSMLGTAFAAYTRQETLHFSGVKLMLDGEYVELTDSTGAPVEPFIINGTTYLPVGNVAKMAGLQVGWDGETKTVILTSPKAAEDTTPSTEETTTPGSEETVVAYIGNSNTWKFHDPDCGSVEDIVPENQVTLTSRDEALRLGYQPCGRCKP